MAEDQRRPQSTTFSNAGPISPELPSPPIPLSPPRGRPPFQRFSSGPSAQELNYATIPEVREEADLGTYGGSRGHQAFGAGGASTSAAGLMGPATTSRDTTSPIVSPPIYSRTFSQSTAYDPVTPYGGSSMYGPPADDLPSRYNRPSQSSLQSGLEPPHASTERLTPKIPAASVRSTGSRRSKYDNEFTPDACPTHKTFYQGGSHWLTVIIWILAIFSTVFSGIYLVIALRAPRWGRSIQSKGSLTASTAGVLTQLFGKLIELSFVAVFVTFLGQVLSRRAFSRDSRGITLAEMSMRQWIMQPGTLLTHYEAVRYAALTFLGALALTVAILAMLYTTAASALITPVLRFGAWEPMVMWGTIKTTFANPIYLAKTCQTPILSNSWDDDYSAQKVGQTCLTIDAAANGFHNYQQYISRWADLAKSGNGTDNQAYRPQGYGLFQQNTTVNGSWIHNVDTKEVSHQYNRIINNVTLAMPHVGVFQAARDVRNGIMQPEDLDRVGVYNIKASLPSPYLNVLCAHVKKEEISSMVYETAFNATLNVTADLPTGFTSKFNWGNFSTIKTPVDELFGWDKGVTRPVFYKFPAKWNTILNNTALWGQDSMYLLGTGGPGMESTARGEHLLCKAKAGLTPICSTEYIATGTGGEMASRCEDHDDPMAFIKGNSSRITTTSLDWIQVAVTVFNALSLNNGVTDGGASNARLLMQLMLQKMELNPALPSPAEALAVMTGCSLLASTQDSPFVEFWNYSNTELENGAYQAFNASIRAQQYASGGSQAYQRGFIVVLFAVFILNIFVLIYFIINRGLVTDFSEPPNLFSLAVNSPPNALMRGSCGAGPESGQYAIKWGVEMEGEHLYITDKQGTIYPAASSGVRAESAMSFGALFGRRKWKQVPSQTENLEMGASTAYTGRQPPEEEEEDHDIDHLKSRDSHLSRMYSKIAKRKSVL